MQPVPGAAPPAAFPAAKPLQFAQGQTYKDRAGYLFVMLGKAGCPGTPGALDEMAHFAEENGLSAGWVFILLLSIVLCLYCSCGMGYKYKMIGVTGIEAIPNVDFWRSYPGLVKDGVGFTVAKLQQCAAKGGGSGGSYSNVSRADENTVGQGPF